MTRRRLLAWLAVLAVAAGCDSRRPPNVLVVVVDTLRADRVGVYGNARGLTPHIDRLAARAAVFQHAYAQAPWTNPSVASLFTSRFQSQHGVIAIQSILGDDEVTLAEVLKARGYATGAFCANSLLLRNHGYAQGFDEYRAYWTARPRDTARPKAANERAQVLNHDALEWLAEVGTERPVFLYLQYMETHTPYEPPADVLDRLLEGRPKPDLGLVNYVARFGHLIDIPPQGLRAVEDVYDTEVVAVDRAIGELLAALDARGFLSGAVVVITADHGDEFKDHGLMGHDYTLYDEVIHVPLLVAVPGSSGRRDVADVVGLVDIAPTLLELVGAEAPAAFEGRSLTAAIAGRRDGAGPQTAYSELLKPEGATRLTPHERAIVVGRHKLIAGVGGEQEFYALDADPGERNANALDDGARTALARALDDARRHALANASPRRTQPIDAATRERLRALGYTE